MATKQTALKRPFTTDYGLTKGHCATVEGAKIAAVTYCVRHGQRYCTIEGPDGAKARLFYDGHWGLLIVAVGKGSTKNTENNLTRLLKRGGPHLVRVA